MVGGLSIFSLGSRPGSPAWVMWRCLGLYVSSVTPSPE